MRKIYNIIVLLGLVLFVSCERELETEGISEIVFYPEITMEGEVYNSILVGESFDDPGATAISNELEIDVTVNNTIDNSTPGLYTITYSALNEDGYPASATRYVAVLNEDVSGFDLSGEYKGTGFATSPSVVPVTKLADGLYHITDALSSANGIATIFLHISETELMVPEQPTGFGIVAVGPEYKDTYVTLTADGFEWEIYIGSRNYGPVTFVKQ